MTRSVHQVSVKSYLTGAPAEVRAFVSLQGAYKEKLHFITVHPYTLFADSQINLTSLFASTSKVSSRHFTENVNKCNEINPILSGNIQC